MIEGIRLKQLKVIPDERGRLIEIMRSDDEFFTKFGQLYITTAYPGTVKAWHYHKKQTDNFCVVKGMMKIVVYDERDDSPTKGEINEFFIGEHYPCILQIPKLLWHGFKCISDSEAICLNCPTEVYDYQQPDEFRADPHKNHIPYDWSRKDG